MRLNSAGDVCIVTNNILSLRCDLENFDLKSIGQQFDVILIEPPLEEYARSYGVTNTKFWEWEKIMALDIGAVGDTWNTCDVRDPPWFIIITGIISR